MNAKQHQSPKYVDILVDFAAIRAQAAAYGNCSSQMPSDAMFRTWPNLSALILAGIAICGIASVAFTSLSNRQADAPAGIEKYAMSAVVERNSGALRRSRAWWEGYGRRHLQARHDVGNLTD
jgi:hypothetical protein